MDSLAQVLDVFLHLDAHLSEWAGVLGPWLYALLFLIVFCETDFHVVIVAIIVISVMPMAFEWLRARRERVAA